MDLSSITVGHVVDGVEGVEGVVEKKVMVEFKICDLGDFSEEALYALTKALEGRTKFYTVDEFNEFSED